MICGQQTQPFKPGTEFRYSSGDYVLLGIIIKRVSGLSLAEFARRRIFEPLGMTDTGFNPPVAKHSRIAPTERCEMKAGYPCNTPDAPHLRGIVHDPTSRRMGGVAGHAGLFGTARDLSRFARMYLNQGMLDGVRPQTVPCSARLPAAGMTSVPVSMTGGFAGGGTGGCRPRVSFCGASDQADLRTRASCANSASRSCRASPLTSARLRAASSAARKALRPGAGSSPRPVRK